MKSRARIALLVLLLGLCIEGCETIVSNDSSSFLVGRVVDRDSGVPISGASIYMKNSPNVPDSTVIASDTVVLSSGKIQLRGFADSTGYFGIQFLKSSMVPSRIYPELIFTKAGYHYWSYSIDDTIVHLNSITDSITVRMVKQMIRE